MSAIDDFKRLLSLIPGGASVDQKLADFEAYIKAAAKAGAEEAIPDIKASIQPYIIASLAIGGAGLLAGLFTIRALKRRGIPLNGPPRRRLTQAGWATL